MGEPTYFSAISGSRVNREKGILEGVSVLTQGDAIGHPFSIDSTTLEQLKECASQFSDGVQVKVNHGTGFDSIVGVLRNFRIDGQKLIADLHLLRNHNMRERIMEIAEEMPGSVGLSVVFSGGKEVIEKKTFARPKEIYSVDLVDQPAANPSGLFRRVDSPENDMAAEVITPEKSILEKIKSIVLGEPINFEAKAKDLEIQLARAQAEITELSALKVKVAELEAEKTEFAAKIADFDAKVEAKAAEKAAAINASLGVAPAPGSTAGDGKKDFASLVAAKVVTDKCSKATAVSFCVQNFPAEYAAWRKSGNTQTL